MADAPGGPRWTDLPTQAAALLTAVEDRGVHTLVLRDPATLGWLLGGRVNVPQTLDTACLDVVLDGTPTDPRITVVTNAIEAPRLRDTELAGAPVEWAVVPWWGSREAMLPRGADVGSDRAADGQVAVTTEIAAVRRVLTPHQQDLLREVCRDAAAAATACAAALSPTTTEYAAAGHFARELLSRELDPIVLMVGGADRLADHRHPLPTSRPLGDRGMLVACGRRHGLVASVTRIVSFASVPSADHQSYLRLLEVERSFLDATRPGARLGDVFAAGAAAYAEHGFAADEWHRHHQGGLSGLQPREFPAHLTTDLVLPAGAVVAWNPSGGGWKVEDTALVGADATRCLVDDRVWPTVTVGGRTRPDVLVP